MRIIQTKDEFKVITNAETLAHIREVHAKGLQNPDYGDREKAKLRRLHGVINEVHDHLTRIGLSQTALPTSATDDGQHDDQAPADEAALTAHIEPMMKLLNKLPRASRLTKKEKAMICNLRPRTAEEIDCIVEEADERLGGEEGVEAFLGKLEGVFAKHGWGDDQPGEGGV